jgi:hypothetical protein
LIPDLDSDSGPNHLLKEHIVADEQKPTEQAPKSEWVKPQIALVEAGSAEAAPVVGPDGYYNYS